MMMLMRSANYPANRRRHKARGGGATLRCHFWARHYRATIPLHLPRPTYMTCYFMLYVCMRFHGFETIHQ